MHSTQSCKPSSPLTSIQKPSYLHFISPHVTLIPLSQTVIRNRGSPPMGSDFPWRPHLQHYQLTLHFRQLSTPTATRFPSLSRHTVNSPTMAAAIKALNAKIRSNKYTDYFCSTRTFSQCSRSISRQLVCARMRRRGRAGRCTQAAEYVCALRARIIGGCEEVMTDCWTFRFLGPSE
jgi:hypothetical protein